MLIEYVRDSKNQRVGVVVCDEYGCIGWSKCNTKLDRFNKQLGLRIAYGRCKMAVVPPYPFLVAPVLERMADRAARYFKADYTSVVNVDETSCRNE